MSYVPSNMDTGSMNNFFVHVAGTTNRAHEEIVERLKKEGQTEVTSPEQCDYLLVFCPVASRVGTDISEALDHIPAGKPVILVVMHHTFNQDQIVAESSRQVKNPIVLLTVDCLFHEGKLLSCYLNHKMWYDVCNFLGVPQGSLWRISLRWMKKKWRQVFIFSLVMAVLRFGVWGGSLFNQKESG